jgi:hypothetical protein
MVSDGNTIERGGNEANKDVVKLEVNPILSPLTKTKMLLNIGGKYRMLVLRLSRSKNTYVGLLDLGGKHYHIGRFRAKEGLADSLRGCPDIVIASNADAIADAIYGHIMRWEELLVEKEYSTSFNSKIDSTGYIREKESAEHCTVLFPYGDSGVNQIVEWFNQLSQLVKELWKRFGSCSDGSEYRKRACQRVSEMWKIVSGMQPDYIRFDDILLVVSTIFGEEIAELLEIVATVGLTLRFVDRSRGIINNRPVWLLVISRPSSLKTVVLNMFKESPYMFYVADVTKASFLPADPDQEPLIARMHNKVTIFPTLSSIATKKPDEAKEILAVLESIYDGEYRRSTAKGTRGLPIDTVVIGSLTPEIFELDMLPKMISYGSRFLIHRYDLSQDQALTISYLLGDAIGTQLPNILTKVISSLFTYAIDNTSFDKLVNVALTPSQESDLDVLSDLMSRLRVVVHRRIDWITDVEESTGREKIRRVEFPELSQFDAPIRAKLQLLNFIRANAMIRNVPRIVGVPQVDDHVIRFACKLAVSSSYRYIHQIIMYLLQTHDKPVSSQYDIGEALRLSQSTIRRFIDALHVAEVVTDTVTPRLEEKYYRVLAKYLLDRCKKEEGGKST